MNNEKSSEPLEGFQITDYDPETKYVTIKIHPIILSSPSQVEALAKKCKEIITSGPNVEGVHVEPRE